MLKHYAKCLPLYLIMMCSSFNIKTAFTHSLKNCYTDDFGLFPIHCWRERRKGPMKCVTLWRASTLSYGNKKHFFVILKCHQIKKHYEIVVQS